MNQIQTLKPEVIAKDLLKITPAQHLILKNKYQNVNIDAQSRLTDSELAAFYMYCSDYGLDPTIGEASAIKFKGVMTPVSTIQGLRCKADETGRYRPSDEAVDYVYKDEYKTDENPRGLYSATVAVYKYNETTREWHKVVGVALWDDYGSGRKIWREKPHVMLAKCAEAQAIRKAFPKLGNLYDRDEFDHLMEQQAVQDITPKTVEEVRNPSYRLHDDASGQTLEISESDMLSFIRTKLAAVRDEEEMVLFDRFKRENAPELKRYAERCPEDIAVITRLTHDIIQHIKGA